MKTQKQEESPVKQRLATFAKSQQISVRKFERSCGLTEGYINAIRVAGQSCDDPEGLPGIERRLASHR